LVIFYCGNAEGLAQHICTTLKIARPSLNIVVFDGEYGHNIVLPYIAYDVSSALLISGVSDISCTYRALQALTLTGVETVAILPTVTTEIVRSYIRRWSQTVHMVEVDSTLYRLSLLHSSLRLALSLADKDTTRVRRIEKELDIKSVARELIEEHKQVVGLGKKLSSYAVAVSRALLAAGEELIDRGFEVTVIGRHGAETLPPKLVVYTSVEEQVVNEYMTKLTRRGIGRGEITIMKINTDPLTAPLYALIVFHAMMLGHRQ